MTTALQTQPLTKLDSVSFDRFVRERQPLTNGDGRLDLNGITLITPAALVPLAALCHAMAKVGKDPQIVTGDESVRRYLLRSGFLREISSVTRIEPEITPALTLLYGLRQGSNPMLLEVTRINNGAALPELLDQIVWVLRYRLKYRKRDAFDVTMAISEICQNTFDHNSGTTGLIAMQVYGKGNSRFLEIGVSDDGDGLAVTLRRNSKNGPIRSDFEAIQRATELGSSEHDDPTRGTGLYHLLQITYRYKGSVQIRSGTSKVRYRMDRQQGWGFAVTPTPGVHVALTLPSKAAA
jgi:anti-anti-sigma regulatory factor/anti-sigma regulatory factor (Ser/Thr protein kinase)